MSGPYSEAERWMDIQIGVWRVEKALREIRQADAKIREDHKRECRDSFFLSEFGRRAPKARRVATVEAVMRAAKARGMEQPAPEQVDAAAEREKLLEKAFKQVNTNS